MKYIKKYENYVDIKVDRRDDESKKIIDDLLEDINYIIQPVRDINLEVNFADHFIPADRSSTDDWKYFYAIEISDDKHLDENPMLIDVVGDVMRYCDINLKEYGFKCSVITYYYDKIGHLSEMTRVLNPEELFKIDSWADRTVDYIDVIKIRIIRD